MAHQYHRQIMVLNLISLLYSVYIAVLYIFLGQNDHFYNKRNYNNLHTCFSFLARPNIRSTKPEENNLRTS